MLFWLAENLGVNGSTQIADSSRRSFCPFSRRGREFERSVANARRLVIILFARAAVQSAHLFNGSRAVSNRMGSILDFSALAQTFKRHERK